MALIFTITTVSRLMLAGSSKTMSSGSDVCALTDVCSEERLCYGKSNVAPAQRHSGQ